MASHRSIFATSILLFALLAIASATDYAYGPTSYSKPKTEVDNKPYSTKSDYEVSKHNIDYEYSQTQEIEKSKSDIDYNLHFSKPNYKVPKPKINYRYGPVTKIEKPEPETNNGYNPSPKVEKPKFETVYTSNPNKPNYEVPKPKTDYGYSPTPKVEKPKSEVVYKPNPTKPDYEIPKPKTNYGYAPTPKIEKPKTETDYKLHPTKPDYEVPKPKGNYEQRFPAIIGVQGTVLCKSGSNYSPIQGAVARITCKSVNEVGYETGPITVLSHVTDSKGYYYATLSFADFGSKLKINECRAYLESSPLETCKVPTDVNHGISGAAISSYRVLENNFRLYSVPTFFYTSQAKPIPGY